VILAWNIIKRGVSYPFTTPGIMVVCACYGAWVSGVAVFFGSGLTEGVMILAMALGWRLTWSDLQAERRTVDTYRLRVFQVVKSELDHHTLYPSRSTLGRVRSDHMDLSYITEGREN
jgi:hypothetical protein